MISNEILKKHGLFEGFFIVLFLFIYLFFFVAYCFLSMVQGILLNSYLSNVELNYNL